MYSIYHIPGIKIGCTKQKVSKRIKQQGYTNFEILETHTDINIASEREKELNLLFGFGWNDSQNYLTITSIMGEERKHNGLKSQSIVYTCPHCNIDMKGSLYFRYHGDRCKYA